MPSFQMRTFLLLLCVVVVRANLEKYGPFQLILHSNLIECHHEDNLNFDVDDINVHFYDFQNNVDAIFSIKSAAERILSSANFDKMRRMIFFVPGYKSSITKKPAEFIRQAFRDLPNSYLIILDHSIYTSGKGGRMKSYERSVQYVIDIGNAFADMLVSLKNGGVSAKHMHCIGHSLGGQVLGRTGQMFTNSTGDQIWRITALDPAGPCFSNSLINEQVRSGVAEYVEVYHCNAGGLGSSAVLADVDFFANKGIEQPHCGTPLVPDVLDSHRTAKCSHQACVELWAATVKHQQWYLAWACDSYKKFKKGLCAGNHVGIAGFWNPGDAKGVYYFTTDGYA